MNDTRYIYESVKFSYGRSQIYPEEKKGTAHIFRNCGEDEPKFNGKVMLT